MRASDLIGLDVYDAAGKNLGVVTDLRCVQDGPLRGSMQAPRVAELIVSRRHTGSLLGYDRRSQQGPWLIRAVIQRLHRHAVLVPWGSIADTTGRITLRAGKGELKPLPE
ncbi:MAG: PRC-barrel domain-containing protein [Actinomycetota bacterium]